jgi:hypothetical protein
MQAARAVPADKEAPAPKFYDLLAWSHAFQYKAAVLGGADRDAEIQRSHAESFLRMKTL